MHSPIQPDSQLISPSPAFAQVALPVPLFAQFDYALTYPLPVEDEGVYVHALKVGARVRVSFANRSLIGIVTKLLDQSEYVEAAKIKPIEAVLDAEPVLTPSLFKLARTASAYYHYPLGEVLNCFLPNALAKGKPLIEAQKPYWRVSDRADDLTQIDALKSKKQRDIVIKMQERASWDADDLNATFGTGKWRAAIKRLTELGLVELLSSPASCEFHMPQGLELNSEQQAVVTAVLKENEFDVYLLYGVTGSGKTEVYLQLCAQVLAAGQQVLVLVPEIGLTPQLLTRFKARFNVPMVCMHSGMSDAQRLHAWYLAKKGHAKVVIGTRSALFTPMPELGMVVVDEEHDASFKQQEGFRYHARDLAIMRAKMHNVPVLLGSATPSLESLHNAKQGRYQAFHLTKRAGGVKAPRLTVVDSRKHYNGAITPHLEKLMREHLNAQRQVMLFLNRRGFAPVLMCPSCGWHATCQRCDANPTYHLHAHALQCHHCDTHQRAPSVCPDCGYSHLETNGLGTEQLEAQVKETFPDKRILRIDRDSTARKGALQACFDQVNSGEVDIVLGTQLLAKGHHFPNVTLVGVLDCDRGFFSADFRGEEHTGQMLLQVAGRAGREHTDIRAQVVIQSTQPENPVLMTLIKQGYTDFANNILNERAQIGFPPAGHMALLRAESVHRSRALHFLDEVVDRICADSVEVLGPIASPMEKRAGRFRAQVMLRSNARAPLHAALESMLNTIQTMGIQNTVRWSLDVDPISTF